MGRADIVRAWAKGTTRSEAMKSATSALENMRKTRTQWIKNLGEESYLNAERKLMEELQGLNLAETTDPLGGVAQELSRAGEVRMDPKRRYEVGYTDPDQPAVLRGGKPALGPKPDWMSDAIYKMVSRSDAAAIREGLQQMEAQLQKMAHEPDTKKWMYQESRDALKWADDQLTGTPGLRTYGRRYIDENVLPPLGVKGSDIMAVVHDTGKRIPNMRLVPPWKRTPAEEQAAQTAADIEGLRAELPPIDTPQRFRGGVPVDLASMDDSDLNMLVNAMRKSQVTTASQRSLVADAELEIKRRSLQRASGTRGAGPPEEQLGPPLSHEPLGSEASDMLGKMSVPDLISLRERVRWAAPWSEEAKQWRYGVPTLVPKEHQAISWNPRWNAKDQGELFQAIEDEIAARLPWEQSRYSPEAGFARLFGGGKKKGQKGRGYLREEQRTIQEGQADRLAGTVDEITRKMDNLTNELMILRTEPDRFMALYRNRMQYTPDAELNTGLIASQEEERIRRELSALEQQRIELVRSQSYAHKRERSMDRQLEQREDLRGRQAGKTKAGTPGFYASDKAYWREYYKKHPEKSKYYKKPPEGEAGGAQWIGPGEGPPSYIDLATGPMAAAGGMAGAGAAAVGGAARWWEGLSPEAQQKVIDYGSTAVSGGPETIPLLAIMGLSELVPTPEQRREGMRREQVKGYMGRVRTRED